MEIVASREGGVLEIALDRPQRRTRSPRGCMRISRARCAKPRPTRTYASSSFAATATRSARGNDVEDFAPIRRPPWMRRSSSSSGTASQATKPFVAAVHGSAVGIGTTLLLHCELVYAADDARFSLPFTRLGLVPEFASSYLLPLFAGYHRAAELLLLGEPFDARRCI